MSLGFFDFLVSFDYFLEAKVLVALKIFLLESYYDATFFGIAAEDLLSFFNLL